MGLREKYEYGTAYTNNRRARRNKKTGAVQFIMWKAGEQGHEVDYWINFDSYWWDTFVPDQKPLKKWYQRIWFFKDKK